MDLFWKKNKKKNIKIENVHPIENIIEKKSVNFRNEVYYLNDQYGKNAGFKASTKRNNWNDLIESYYEVEPINTGIKLIANAKKSLRPYILNTKTNEYTQEHPLVEILLKPNFNQSYSEFIEKANLYKKLTGNVFYLIKSSGHEEEARVIEIIPTSYVEITERSLNSIDISGPYSYEVYFPKNSSRMTFTSDISSESNADIENPRYFSENKYFELIHDNGINLKNDSSYGDSQITSIYYHGQRYLKALEYNTSLLDNGPNLYFEYGKTDNSCDNSLTDEQFGRLKCQLDNDYSGTLNAGKSVLLEGGLVAKPVTMTDKDMSFLEGAKFDRKIIFSNLKIPLALIGEEDSSFSSNSAYAESRKSLYENTAIPEVQEFFDFIYNRIGLFRYDLEKYEILTYKADEIEELEKVKKEISLKTFEIFSKLGRPDLLTDDQLRGLLGFNTKEENDKETNKKTEKEEEDEELENKELFIKLLLKSGRQTEECAKAIKNWDDL